MFMFNRDIWEKNKERFARSYRDVCTVARMVGVDIPFNNYITGITAFTHKAGIHAKAILNNPETYEILDPHAFGLTRYISIAHRLTGWNAIRRRAEQLGLELEEDELKAITARVKEMADDSALTLDDVDALLTAADGGRGRGSGKTKGASSDGTNFI